MTDQIGRGDYVVGLDKSQVGEGLRDAEREIESSAEKSEKAYADSGKRAGSLFSDALSGGLKLAGAAGAAALAMTTRGLIELNSVQADYRRETGATAAEADKAGKAINAMSGRNIQPMREIGSTLAAVHTQMGLTGDEAEKTTQRFLRFARATGQDSTEAVRSFDDVLDAWNLTAADAGGLMDKLIASHQKFGTSVDGSQQALASMAPQLKALNLSIDDGIGLLNLFASSGLDASGAQRALNTAISQLPKGTTLQDFIAHLATIPDDGQRAAEAMKVFGSRAGAGLANAIKPGVDSIDRFKVSAIEAAGATDRAADAMDSSFGAQAQLMLKRFGAAANDAFREIGPLLTGLGALSSVGATFGVDRLVRQMLPKLIAAMKDAGVRAGSALADGLSSVWTGAGGTIVGNVIASRIEVILDPVRNSRLAGAWAAAGAKAATIYLEALYVGDALIAAIGTRFGTVAGRAAGVAFRAAFILGIAGIVAEIADQIHKLDLGGQVHDAIFGPNGRGPFDDVGGWLSSLPWPWGPVGAPDWAKTSRVAADGGKATGAMFIDALKTGLTELGPVWQTIVEAMAAHRAELAAAAREVGGDIKIPIKAGAVAAAEAVSLMHQSIVTSIEALRSDLAGLSQGAANAIYDPIVKQQQIALTKMEIAEQDHIIKTGKAGSREVLEARIRRGELNKQLLNQITDLTTYGDDATRISRIKAALASKEVAKAYRNGTPEQRAAIDLWRQGLTAELTTIQARAKKGGATTASNFSTELGRGAPKAHTQAGVLTGGAKRSFADFEANAGGYGSRTGAAWSSALSEALSARLRNFQHEVARYRSQVVATSPPKPGAVLHGIDRWGYATGESYVDSMARGIRDGYAGFRAAVGGLALGSLSMPVVTGGSTMTLSGTARVEIGLSQGAADALKRAGYDERAVAGLLSADGLFTNLQQRIAMTSG